MPESPSREQLAQRVAEHRKQLGDRGSLDPRVRELSQSSAQHLMPRRAHLSLATALFAILGALALVGCVGTATAVIYGSAWLQGVLNDPTTVVQSFYGAVEASDYERASSYFSDGARAHLPETAFAGQFASYDAIDGQVVAYTLSTPRYSHDGNSVAIEVTVMRRANPRATETHTLALIKQDGSWRVSALAVRVGDPSPTPRT